jgi:hypothetical protein
MIAATRSERAAGAFAVSMFAASLGFGIGMFGILGFLVFQAYLPFMLFTAGPGAALLAWGMTVHMEKRAPRAASRSELWRVALLIVLPPALLNGAVALKLMELIPSEVRPLIMTDVPLAYLLASLWGALGLVYGTLNGLKPGRTP